MNTSDNPLTRDPLTQLLETHQPLTVPEGFSQQVMQKIAEQESAIQVEPQRLFWWQWIALVSAAISGVSQVLTLIFSAWHITSAL